ncbi:MAG: hypothetical protein LBL07_12990 [Tannerella sp.]|jgi:hypothetical protein|nr:hypothetical protein [Tannerella sp.]
MKMKLENSADTSGLKDELDEVKRGLTEVGQMMDDVVYCRKPGYIPDSLPDILEIYRENTLYRRAHHDILMILHRKKIHPIVQYDVDNCALRDIFRQLSKMFPEKEKNGMGDIQK